MVERCRVHLEALARRHARGDTVLRLGLGLDRRDSGPMPDLSSVQRKRKCERLEALYGVSQALPAGIQPRDNQQGTNHSLLRADKHADVWFQSERAHADPDGRQLQPCQRHGLPLHCE